MGSFIQPSKRRCVAAVGGQELWRSLVLPLKADRTRCLPGHCGNLCCAVLRGLLIQAAPGMPTVVFRSLNYPV